MKITVCEPRAVRSDLLYGHFIEHFHRQIYGGVYDPGNPLSDSDGFRTDVIDAMRRIKVPILRWPGGCFVSSYHWQKAVGPVRTPFFDKAWRVEDPNSFGTNEFVSLCRKVGCEPYICTNAGTGTAEEMSDWLEYCNLESEGEFARMRIAHGYPLPHSVKYWSIGNENYGWWEIGAKSPEEWGRLVLESAKMMKHVDPTAQLSAAALADIDWNVNLLKMCGQQLDWISIHRYWNLMPNENDFADYGQTMAYTADLDSDIRKVRGLLMAFGLEKQIRIAYDEWNLRGWWHPNLMDTWDRARLRREDEAFYRDKVLGERDKNDINSIYTMADAVFSAAFLNTCLRNCDLVGMACFSPVVNTRGAVFTHEKGIVLRPQYFVFELYANLLKDTVLDLWKEDVPVLTGQIGDDEKTVDAVDIVVTADGKGYAVAAVNKDPENAQTVSLRVLEDPPREMRAHTLNGPSPDAYNDVDRTEVGVTASPWEPFTGAVILPPHSVCVIELR